MVSGRVLLRSFLSISLVTFLFVQLLHAGIDSNYDWVGGKRTLKIKIADETKKLGSETIKDVMDEAIENWNNTNSGWTFEYAGAEDTADVDVAVEEITDNKGQQKSSGGASTSGFQGNPAAPYEVTHMDVTFDPKPKEGFDWGMEGDDKMDPVAVAKHELGHLIRLDHEGGVDTGHLGDPVTPGNHEREPSDRDKKHATAAATVQTKKEESPASEGIEKNLSIKDWSHNEGPGGDEYPWLELDNMETRLTLPEYAFANPATVTMVVTSGANVIDRWTMPGRYDRFVRGMSIVVDPNAVSGLPGAYADIQIPYFDNVTDMDPSLPVEYLDLADVEWGPIVSEGDLYAVKWNPVTHEWVDIMAEATGFAIDVNVNLVTFSIPCSMLTEFPGSGGYFTSYIGIGGTYEITDCNGNGVHDSDDIAEATSSDNNHNSIPDGCEKCPDRLAADISGPLGEPDCYVDLHDLGMMASQWLDCNDPDEPTCVE